MLAGEHAGKLHFADLLLEGRKEFADFGERRLVLPLFAEFGQYLQVFEFLTDRFPALDDFLQSSARSQQLLGLFPPVPEIGLGNLGIEFGDTFFFCRYVKDTPSALRA
jgi:hypothetical protein